VPSGLLSAGLSLANPSEIIRVSWLDDELREMLRVHGGGCRAEQERSPHAAASSRA
jgi:hypothetical protein